jgi:aspartate kinase
MFETLEAEKIPVLLVTTSEIKVSVLIREDQREAAIRALHATFELGKSG